MKKRIGITGTIIKNFTRPHLDSRLIFSPAKNVQILPYLFNIDIFIYTDAGKT